jgi:hypothetical protein
MSTANGVEILTMIDSHRYERSRDAENDRERETFDS